MTRHESTPLDLVAVGLLFVGGALVVLAFSVVLIGVKLLNAPVAECVRGWV